MRKVELLTKLKIGSNQYWQKGAIFFDPLPSEIEYEVSLKRKTVKVTEVLAPVQESKKSEQELPKKVETQKEPEKSKSRLAKRAK